MLRRILTAAIAVVLTVTGLILMEQLLPQISYFLGYNIHSKGLLGYSYIHWLFAIVSVLFFSWVGWVITPFLIKFLLKYSELVASVLAKAPSADIIVSLIGVLVGLILANLIGAPFSRLPIVGSYIPIILSIVLALTGAKVASHKSKDILGLFYRSRPPGELSPAKPDDKGFIRRWTIIEPINKPNSGNTVFTDSYIQTELTKEYFPGQFSADINSLPKAGDQVIVESEAPRAGGRGGFGGRGAAQAAPAAPVIVQDPEHDMIQDVDSKLVALAKDTNSIIVTNDFNLNKVASIQGIRVLNINDLANAVKPVVIPGEEMTAYLLREGKESGQAIAYLQDGTMIVVEGGRKYIGNKIRIAVTSVLQTSAGRMIFAKVPKNHDVRDMLAGAEGK